MSPFGYLWLHLCRLLRDIQANSMQRKDKSVAWICISYHGRYTGKRIATFAPRVKAELPFHKRKASFKNFSHASLLKSATKYCTVRVIPLKILIVYKFVCNSKLLVNPPCKYANILVSIVCFISLQGGANYISAFSYVHELRILAQSAFKRIILSSEWTSIAYRKQHRTRLDKDLRRVF